MSKKAGKRRKRHEFIAAYTKSKQWRDAQAALAVEQFAHLDRWREIRPAEALEALGKTTWHRGRRVLMREGKLMQTTKWRHAVYQLIE